MNQIFNALNANLFLKVLIKEKFLVVRFIRKNKY